MEVLHSEIAYDKVDLVCEENVKAKPTINNSGLLPTQTQSTFLVYG